MENPEHIIKDPDMSYEGKMMYIQAIIANSIEGVNNTLKRTIEPCDMVRDIKEFHEKFNQAYNGDVRKLPKEISDFRVKFLTEELMNEYVPAVMRGDLAEQIDGLFDLIYVAMGTLYLMGVDIEGVWQEGHTSNMSKELVEKGKGKMGFTVHKGKDYFKPNFKKFAK